MSSNAPWSVKGIDPKARETAKDLARRSGLTLGEWLSQRIAEEGGADLQQGPNSVSDALEELTGRLEAAEQRSTLAVTGVDQTMRGMLARIETAEREQVAVGARFEGAIQEASKVQAALEARLRKLEDQAAGPRSAEALKSLEASLGRVANHLYDGESRTRESLADMRRDMSQLAARLDGVEKAKGSAGEDVAGRLIERLDQAQARMEASVRELQSSLLAIEQRLGAAEARLEQGVPATADVERRLDEMAANLAQGLQAAREEMSKQLRDAADSGADRLDQALLEMTAHVQAAERRSADALERMGQEVLRVAETLNRRVQGIETRTAGAISKVGSEVARVVDALESRADRTEAVQSEALERLGGEIGRVTEKLADRIGTAERRSAQAVDEVAEKVSRISERLSQRYEHSASDLAERIRQSEERTQRLLEEARERIERRLAEAPRPPDAPAVMAAPPPPPFGPAVEPAYAEPKAEAAAPPPTLYPDAAPFGQSFAPADFIAVEPQFDEADIEAAHDFTTPVGPQSEADFVEDAFIAGVEDPDEPALSLDLVQPAEDAEDRIEPLADEEDEDETFESSLLEPVSFAADPMPIEPITEARIQSTRELIEQARAAARASGEQKKKKKKKSKASVLTEGGLDEPSALQGVGFGHRRRKSNNAALGVTLMGATVMLGAGGYLLVNSGLLNGATAGDKKDAPPAPAASAPRVAVALDPKPIDKSVAAAVPSTAAADDASAQALYLDGRRRIEAGQKGGLELIQKAANLGNAASQFYLGRLYEDGSAGLSKDLVEARRWYERAATAGERGAMHNVALMYFEGVGGPKNTTVAAQWFRQAAELGLVDSQYNLGQLYEQGLGVSQNAAEAYKWYLLASKGGTSQQRQEARDAANRVRTLLPADARATAERIASDIELRNKGGQLQITQDPNVDIAAVQRALARLGYYRGPTNGSATTDLRVAIQGYQRDQGLSPNGTIDSSTLVRISPYMR